MEYRSTGTSQTERLSPERITSQLPIIGSSNTELFNFTQDFSSLLHYWNDQGNIEGNWKPFFQSDTSFVLADISRYEIDHLQRERRRLYKLFLSTHQPEQQESYLIGLYEIVLQSGETLGKWYYDITHTNNVDTNISHTFLEIAQSNLSNNLLALIPIFDNLSRTLNTSPNIIAQKDVAHQTSVVSHLLTPLHPTSKTEFIYPGHGTPSSLLSFWQCFDQIYRSIFTTISQIFASVPAFFQNSLETVTHSPQVSLLFAFFKMLEPVRDQINTLSSDHHQFYFQTILQQTPQSYTPDQTFLTFQTAPNTNNESLFIPAQTEFIAGTSSTGTPIIYETERNLSINQAKPAALQTIYNGTTSNSINKAIQGTIHSAPIANSGNGQGSKLTATPPSWPTFGKYQEISTNATQNLANIGFAISSPSLFYSDGHRRIRFTVLTSLQEITALSNSVQQLHWPPLAPLPNSQSSTKNWEQSLQKLSNLSQSIQQLQNTQQPNINQSDSEKQNLHQTEKPSTEIQPSNPEVSQKQTTSNSDESTAQSAKKKAPWFKNRIQQLIPLISQKKSPTLSTSKKDPTAPEVQLQTPIPKPNSEDTKETNGPLFTSLKKNQTFLNNLLQTITEVETSFREELQSCVVSITKVTQRNPIPLEEWLEAAIELTEFKIKYLLVTQYHQNKVTTDLQKNNQQHKRSKETGMKHLEQRLSDTISHHKESLEHLTALLSKETLGTLPKGLSSQSKALEKITQVITASTKKNPLHHASQLTKLIKSVSTNIHPSEQLKQNSDSVDEIQKLAHSSPSQLVTNIKNQLDSALEDTHSTSSSLFSLQWLTKIKAIIQTAEGQLITSSNKAFLVSPSSETSLKLAVLKAHANVSTHTEVTTQHHQKELSHQIEQHPKKTTHQEPSELNPQLLDLANRNWAKLGQWWHGLNPNLLNHVNQLENYVDQLRNLPINHYTQDLLQTLSLLRNNSKDRDKKKIDLLTGHLQGLKQNIEQSVEQISAQSSNTHQLKAHATQLLKEQKQTLVHSLDQSKQLINAKQLHEQHLTTLSTELKQPSPTETSSPTLSDTILKLEQRLQCWQPKLKPSPNPESLNLQAHNIGPSQYHQLNDYFQAILLFLSNLLHQIDKEADKDQVIQIDQVIKHIQSLQQRIQTIDDTVHKNQQNTLLPNSGTKSTDPYNDVEELKNILTTYITPLAKELQEAPTSNLTNHSFIKHIEATNNQLQNWENQLQHSSITYQESTAEAKQAHYDKINDSFEIILNFLLNLLTRLDEQTDKAQRIQVKQVVTHIHTLQHRIQHISPAQPNNNHVQNLKSILTQHMAPLVKKIKHNFFSDISNSKLFNQITSIKKEFQNWESTASGLLHIDPSKYHEMNEHFETVLNGLFTTLTHIKKEANPEQRKQIDQTITHIHALNIKIHNINTAFNDQGHPANNTPSTNTNSTNTNSISTPLGSAPISTTQDSSLSDIKDIINKFVLPLTEQIKNASLPSITNTSFLDQIKQLNQTLHTWQNQSPPKVTTSVNLPEEPNWAEINAVLCNAFDLEYSGASGWCTPSSTHTSAIYILPAEGSHSPSPSQSGFQIDLELDTNALPPAAWNQTVCGGSYQPDQPVFRAQLNQRNSICFLNQETKTINPYPLLSSLNFQKILIWGDVSNSANFTAQNQLSALKPSKPFGLFGEQPIQGAEFYLGNSESLRKNLDYFINDISWYNLPTSQIGFAEMYRLYNRFGGPNTCYTNAAFQWSIDLLDQGEWIPLQPQILQPFHQQSPPPSAEKALQPLFEWAQFPLLFSPLFSSSISPATSPATSSAMTKPSLPPLPPIPLLDLGPLLNNTLLILEPKDIPSKPKSTPPSSFSSKTLWNNNSSNGFLRFTLETPQDAFGAQQYPNIMADVSSANISRMMDLVAFRTLSEKDQEQLLQQWATQSTPSSPEEDNDDTPNHHILSDTLNTLESAASGILHQGLNIVEKAAELSPNPLVKLLGSSVEELSTDTPHITSSDPSKIFAPIKPPEAPWTPKVKGISMSYGNHDTLHTKSSIDSDIRYYRIHPFGVHQPLLSNSTELTETQLLPDYSSEGYLFIGLEHVNPPQTTNLLFILDEASGNRRIAAPQPNWSFLSSEGWQTIPTTQVRDGTNGFIKSGIISLTLLQSAAPQTELFLENPSLYWIKVTIPSHVSATCQTISVTPQAITVVYKSGADSSTHFNAPLPANTIKKPSSPITDLLKTNQPISSFGGTPPESPLQFHARVSERLRHKDRAITSWDYEHLVLQQFPKIRACLALNSTDVTQGYTPGSVTLLVFPEITAHNNALSPLADRSQLVNITNFLTQRCDPFLQLSIINPNYLFSLVHAEITLTEESDPGHYLQALNQSLIEELAPWSDANSTINPFSVTLTYDSLLQFILSQPYIDSVQSLQLSLVRTQNSTSGGIIQQSGSHPIAPPNLWTLLSSVTQHNLTISTGAPQQKDHQHHSKTSVQAETKLSEPEFSTKAGNSLFLGGLN